LQSRPGQGCAAYDRSVAGHWECTAVDTEKRAAILAVVEQALEGRRLLAHPFYQRWSRGELREGELAAYSGQYRCIEASLPGWLESIQARAGDAHVHELVQRNLDDEVGGPTTHVELFERFAVAVGAPPADRADVGVATRALLNTHDELVSSSAAEGLAAVLTYELQSPEISASKAAGLRSHYRVTDDAITFWDTHAEVEGDHASWTLDAVVAAGGDPATVATAARRTADAWWAFLDEREAAAGLVTD
jgi:pyrroloquinoline-quinone synthase